MHNIGSHAGPCVLEEAIEPSFLPSCARYPREICQEYDSVVKACFLHAIATKFRNAGSIKIHISEFLLNLK